MNEIVQKKENIGFLFGAMASLGYATMGLFVKLATEVNTETLVFFRSFICFFLLLPLILKNRVSLKTKKSHLHLLRTIAGLGAFYSLFYAIKKIALVDAMLLFNTAPLFMPLIVLLWFKDKIPVKRLACVLVGFLGVAVVLKSEFLVFNAGGMMGVLSGFCAAVALVTVRKLSKTESTQLILVFFFFGGIILSFFPMYNSWTSISSPKMWLFIGLMGGAAYFYQYCITLAYTYVHPTKISLTSYLIVVYSGIFDLIIFHKVIDVWTMVGIVLIIGAGIFNVIESRKETTKISS